MNDTPITDEASRSSTAFDTPTNAINFARELERENTRLKKDKERLEWLIKKLEEFLYGEVALEIREEIDKAMNEPTQ